MRKVIGFLAGLAILALTGAAVLAGILLFDYSGAGKTSAALLQPADSQRGRIERPISLENIAGEYVRGRLLQKFAMEYLGVSPDEGELKSRADSRGALRLMSSPDALAEWKKNVLPGLEEMARKKKRRVIRADIRAIVRRGDYFVVPFLAKTWNNPNDMAKPEASAGELYLKIRFDKKIRGSSDGSDFDAGGWLDKGLPAAAIFRFAVDEAVVR